MTHYPDAVWTKPQLIDHLSQTASLFQANVFKPSRPYTAQSQGAWLELIQAVSDMVRQSSLAGKRIDFTDEVSTRGDSQDITSLLDTMRPRAYLLHATGPAQEDLVFLDPMLNHVDGAARGHFSNGVFFICPHRSEQTFFIGGDRIYFYRHLMRAYLEAGDYLISVSTSD